VTRYKITKAATGETTDERSLRVQEFLEAVIALSKSRGLSISHEDGHGGFLVAEYDESLSRWLLDAGDETDGNP
jgi:hypothetical protein